MTNKTLFRRITLVALVAGVLAITTSSPAGASAYPGANGRIVFSSSRTGNFDLYTALPSGKGVKRITRTKNGEEGQAVFSPNGRKIAFTSNRDGNDEIYVSKADGSQAVNITKNSAADAMPNWSPDGKRLVFVSHRNGGLQLWVMKANGTKPVNLFPRGVEPSWSPDGTKIAFTNSDPDGTANADIYVINADGTGLINLSNDAGTNSHYATWSPDGTSIAFVSDRSGTDQIWVMTVDGANPVMITNSNEQSTAPAWSPNNKLIAFIANQGGSSAVYTMKTDGTGLSRITGNDTSPNDLPNWQPLPRRR